MKSWIQFSVWDGFYSENLWPSRVIEDFLLDFEKEVPSGVRWHFLYEPQLLVRVETENQEIFQKAITLACKLGYEIRGGDISKSRKDETGGLVFRGDFVFYGPILWEANADYLWATSKLILRMQETKQLSPKMIRKHIHLLCNQSGRNYLQEFWLVFRHALRSFRLFLKYGFH